MNEHADVIHAIIQDLMENVKFPKWAAEFVAETGYTPEQIVEAGSWLETESGMDNPFSDEDFEG